MNIIAKLYDNRNHRLFDVSNCIKEIEVTTYLEDNPGKCVFSIISEPELSFYEGSTMSLVVDGYPMFKGTVFTKSRSKDVDIIEVTCYDNLRYLQNEDSFVFEGVTSDQIFTTICNEFVLPYRVISKSPYVCAPRSNDATSLYDMIKFAFNDTLANTGEWFILIDNFGELQHVSIDDMHTRFLLGDSSGVTDFEYSSSIDSDTYNQIKLYRDNDETKQREIFIVNDSIHGGHTIKYWGILQLYEKVDESLNIAQIEQKARGMLSLYNNTKRTLDITSIGVPSFRAGSTFTASIADLGDISLVNEGLLVQQCTHRLTNNSHIMELKTEVVRDELRK